jgi:hypothetical protein
VASTSPFDLRVATIPAFLNGELADHPAYDGFEVQRYDDPVRGTGTLVFLSRRADRLVDYYVTPGLELDRTAFVLGAGTRSWNETAFERDTLVVHDDGLEADVRFEDVDGRTIELAIDDRDGQPRRRAELLLAPVSSGVDRPSSMLVVLLHRFDLVRATGGAGVRIDGVAADVGRLPGQRWHGRLLFKYAAPLTTVALLPDVDGPLPAASDTVAEVVPGTAEGSIAALTAAAGDDQVRFELGPAFPAVTSLPDDARVEGRWRLLVDAPDVQDGRHVITGGTWSARRQGSTVDLTLEVTRPWRPGPLPPVERVVTRVAPVFRRWPTTYRWTATVGLDGPPTLRSRWERTGTERGRSYRRATGSAR